MASWFPWKAFSFTHIHFFLFPPMPLHLFFHFDRYEAPEPGLAPLDDYQRTAGVLGKTHRGMEGLLKLLYLALMFV